MNLPLSSSTGYAVRALLCLVGHDTMRYVRDLAAESKVPAPYLAKLIQRLSSAGILISKRGATGGVMLSRPANLISLQEIDDAIEAGQTPDRCIFGQESCCDERCCPLHSFWKETRERARQAFRTTSLADLARFDEQHKTCSAPPQPPPADSIA